MDSRYWKEFENMGEMDVEKRSMSSDIGSRYSKKHIPSRRKRSRSLSRSVSRSRSSSSSSSGSSTRTSSSSSRHHSDRSYSSRKRDRYRRKSRERGDIRTGSYSSGEVESWFPGHHRGGSFPPSQAPDLPPPGFIPSGFPQGPGPHQLQAQFGGSYQGPNFGNNYHGGYPGYDSGPAPAPPNFYPPNFPHGSQPPPHEYGGGPGASSHPPPTNWELFPDTTLPPPAVLQPTGEGIPNHGLEEAKKEAIEQELLQQKRTLAKQREDYVRRKFSLNRELNRLKDQKRILLKEKSKDNERILRENAKLQSEIQQKLKSIDNVIEMLTNIIGDSARLPEVINEIKLMEKLADKPKKKKLEEEGIDDHVKGSMESPELEENFIYYDPGLHWCSDCNIFPKTVSQYLDHLHSTEHKRNSTMKAEDFPWHQGINLEDKSPVINRDSPQKRIPIRGVQFLVPSTAWFCSLCRVWLGDSHCANKHIKSIQHTYNYNGFISKNPHWEVDWLTERTQSYEKYSEAKHHKVSNADIEKARSSSSAALTSLSDQLLAMIAANSKAQGLPTPPPPPPINKSSSSSSDDDPDKKSKKKKKKSKKRKSSKERRSPLKEEIKLDYKSMPDRRVEPVAVNDSFISEWMPKVEKPSPVRLKKKYQEIGNDKLSSKRGRVMSGDSREASVESFKKGSPYEQMYNDHDEAVIFDKRHSSRDKDSLRSKKRIDDDYKFERPSRYDRESSKERSKYKVPERYRPDKEDKVKKDIKSYKEFNERDRTKKSPFPKPKENADKKKAKGKSEKNSDDDVHETSFEKRTSESAAKKKDGKKSVVNNLPKTKLPFIGRMPILKKKVESKNDEKEDKKENNEEDQSVMQPLPIEATVVENPEPVSTAEPQVNELPKSTLIISKRPRLAEPGIVKKEVLFNKLASDNLMEQDMDLDDDNGVPKEEEPAKDELHKDFKDALELLFPEEKKKEEGAQSEKAGEKRNNVEGVEEPGLVAAANAASYMMPAGYDPSMYSQYYNQQAFVQQQWAQMGYDQGSQYPPPYPYPPTIEPPPIEAIVEQPPPATDQPVIQPKKKKNPPSQRKRRQLQKKKQREAIEKGGGGIDLECSDGGSSGLVDEQPEEEENVNEAGETVAETKVESQNNEAMDMSDLAMLGIDEDDAAAQGFF